MPLGYREDSFLNKMRPASRSTWRTRARRRSVPAALVALRTVSLALVCGVLLASQSFGVTAEAQVTPVDYDIDDDGLIEVRTFTQLNAIRWDLNGDGAVDSSANATTYAAAFRSAVTTPRMGCSPRCTGYELASSLNLFAAGNWQPIGDATTRFNATFDGGGDLSISNLFINRPGESDVGLFGQTGSSSVIRNVTLVGVNVTGGNYTGGLVGRNSGSISGVSVAGTVTGTGWTGGLVGLNVDVRGANPITACTASVRVTASDSRVGGLVGQNLAAPITDSHASGNVTGVHWVGGLVGSNYDSVAWNTAAVGLNAIRWSTASGEVTGSGNTVGGLTGFNNGVISDSDALGSTVTGGLRWVGGLVGSNNDPNAHGTNRIIRSTASADVTANTSSGQFTGGLVGWNNGPIEDSHARGDVLGHREVGGLVGFNVADVTDSSATGGVGDASSTGSLVGGLVGQQKSGTISGSAASGVVRTSGQTVGGLVGRNEGSITESAATGDVTGDESVGGLVGFQRNTGSIHASRATGSVTATGESAGGLVGNSEGLIRSSAATGSVTGVDQVGGLVGVLAAKVVSSFARGSVTGSGVGVGGLVGCSRAASAVVPTPSSVLASYATGAVSGAAATTGGFVGIGEPAYLSGTTERAAARFISSFWDTGTSGQSAGFGSRELTCKGSQRPSPIETVTYAVIGRTTSELQTPTGYTGIYATWNVDADDGDTTVTAGAQPWDFGGSSDYPSLRSAGNPPTFTPGSLTRTIAESAALGADVGAVITASDSDGDTLSYTLVGAGARAFSIDRATGQLRVGAVLDRETRETYTVTVQASDGKTVAFKDVEVTVTGENEPPAFETATATRSVAENVTSGTAIGTPVAARDPDTTSLTYSIEGPDAAHFAVDSSTGQLEASADLDHEYRTAYAVTVKASDGSHSAVIDVAITVADADDPGAIRWSSSQPQVGTALTATLVDPDGSVSSTAWEWSLDSSPISGATSATYTPMAADVGKTLAARVTYRDAFETGKEATLSETVRVAPTGTNAVPSFATGAVTRSVDENSAAGTNVGLPVAATDTDTGDVLTYSLAGTDAASFDISPASGQLTTKAVLDAETKASYSVTVVARDPSNASASKPVAITVTGVDEAPVLSGRREVDYRENGTSAVASYTARDPESSSTTITWSLAGADRDDFTITNGRLAFATSPDYDSPADTGRDNVYHVTVEASDDSANPNTGVFNVTFTVTDLDESPAVSGATTVNVAENSYGGVAAFTADDPENGTITWSLAGTDSADFEISTTGRLRWSSRTPPDYESPDDSGRNNVYNVTVRASDGTNTGSQAVTVTVTNVDEQPVLAGLATQPYDENTTGRVGTYRFTDPESAATTWGALTGPDAAAFSLDNGVLTFKFTAGFPSPDFEDPMDADEDNVYRVRLQALDSAIPSPNTGARDVYVVIGNTDENGEVTMNTAQPTLGVPITATVMDDDGVESVETWQWKRDGTNIHGATSATYTPADGDTSVNPHIPTDVGALLTVVATYTDLHGSGKVAELTATNRVAESPGSRSPTFPSTENGMREVAEHTPAGQSIGAPVAATDEDIDDPMFTDALIYSLSGTDADSFDIDVLTGQLLTKKFLNREAKSTHSVTVTAADAGGREAEQSVTITVTDVNEAPDLTDGADTIHHAENGTGPVETYTATDPEQTAITWTLAGADSAAFTIAAGVLAFVDPPDFETKQTYEVRVNASDGPLGEAGTLTTGLDVTVNVTNVNEPPGVTAGESRVTFPENSKRTVQTYRARDPEGSTVIWSLSGTDGDAFNFTGGTLRFNEPPDFEEKNIYNVTLHASDGDPGEPGTLTTDLPVTIDVENVNERGALGLSLLQPQVGTPLVSLLDDEDGVRSVTWQWFSGAAEISGANADSYTPVDSDVGNRLRATATYDDDAATGNTAEVTSNRPVRARPPTNADPVFPATETGARGVGQNTPPGQAFGARVVATDTDNDVLTYSLEQSGDWESFRIDQATGQLRTAAAIDRPTGETYFVRVIAADPFAVEATQDVTITVMAGPVTAPPVSTPVFGGGGGGGGGSGPTGPSPSDVEFEWTVRRDIESLDSGHDKPTGMWSDGATLWLLENGDGADDAVYAYDLESGERVEEHEFELDKLNRAPRGLWSDGQGVAWVSDSGRNKLFAYDLATGERLADRDINLDRRNVNARGIGSDGQTMWVLDGRRDALFAYNLESGEALAEYRLHATNDDPRGMWSDGVTIWVSNHDPKRLFAYRLPALPAEGEAPPEEPQELERVRGEDFTKLSTASNNSPRGIWSDGDVMYVADESDDRVYTFNMPDAIDARLASLTLSGIDIGEFDAGNTDYEGVIGEGVTETTVTAEAMQDAANAVIAPDDADEAVDGHQVALEGVSSITITVTSAGETRERVYRVTFEPKVTEIALSPTWTSVEWPGADGTAVAEADLPEEVVVVYAWDETTGSWLGYFPGLDDVPGLNTLASFSSSATYWVAATQPVTWTVPVAAGEEN